VASLNTFSQVGIMGLSFFKKHNGSGSKKKKRVLVVGAGAAGS
jgi:hypothetical protein